MQRRYVAVRGASLAGGAFQSWLGDILDSRLLLGGCQQEGKEGSFREENLGSLLVRGESIFEVMRSV